MHDRRMDRERMLWALGSTAIAVIGGVLVRKGLESGWRAWFHEDPPQNPDSPYTTWGQALAWSAMAGAAAGVGRVVARRGAVSSWQRVYGSMPPGLLTGEER